MLVQVKIELGHRASVRKALTDDGFTHDWTVFVRGPDGCDIANFIEKVVFNLHHSFVNYKREKTAPPYFVSESGYAGFTLPIDIYFKNKEEPRKIRFQYDLFLRMEASPPVNHTRCEKLTFQNPTEEFKKKLLEAGGTVVNANGEKETAQFTDLFGPPIQSDTVKKSKPHSSSKSKGITTSSGKSIPEPGSKDSSVHSAPSPSAPASLKSNTTTMTTMTTTTTSGSSSGSKSHKSSSKDKHSSSSLKRSSDISQDEGIKKSKKSLSASSLLEGKVKDKHGSGEKSKHSKEKDSTSSKHSSSKEKESSSKEKEASSKDSSSKDSSSKDSSSKDNSSKDMSSKDSSSKDNSSKDTSSKDSSSKDSSSKDNSSKNISSKDSSSKDISSKDSSSSSKHKEKSSSSKSHKSDKEKRKSSKSGKHESKPESSKDTVKSQVKNETVSSSVKVKSEPIEIKSETKMEILEERVNVKMETTSNNSPGGKPTHSKDSFVKERVSSSSHGKHSKEKSHRSGSSQPPVKKRKVISSSSEDSGSSSDNADIEEVLRRLKRIDSASGSEASVNEDDGEESTTRPSSVTSMASTNPSPQPTIQLQTKRALDRLMQDLSDQDDDDDDDDDYLIRSAFRSPVKSFSPSSVKSSHSSPGPGKSSKSSTSPAVKESPVVKESPSRKTSKQTTQSKSVLSPHSQKSSKSSHHSTVESKEHSSTASTPSTLSSQKTLSKSSSSSSKSKSDDRSESSKKDKGNSTFSKGSNSKCETVIKSESTAKEKKSKDKERKSSKESAKERKECKENISEGQFREDRPNANANNNNYASDTLETDLNGHGHIGLGGILEHNLGSAPNEEDLLSLLDLHKKLEAMKDGGILQQIVTVIMDTGKFEIGEASFNFDLCTLDSKTVERLQNFIGGSAS